MKRIYQLGLTCLVLACAHGQKVVTSSMATEIASDALTKGDHAFGITEITESEVDVLEERDRYTVRFILPKRPCMRGPDGGVIAVEVSKATAEVLGVAIGIP
jgi:hypothetical protein